MLFEAGDNAIDIRIVESGESLEVRGQIIGDGFENGEIFLDGNGAAYSAELNEISEFSLRQVARGAYRLTVRGRGKEIVVEDIDLG
jgi:hypothetical protein